MGVVNQLARMLGVRRDLIEYGDSVQVVMAVLFVAAAWVPALVGGYYAVKWMVATWWLVRSRG